MSQVSLFSDEAFYWLEGQFPAFSYAEIPGWLPWISGLFDHLLPHGYFFTRLPHAIAAWSLVWLGMAIHQQLDSTGNKWHTGLLLLSLPLLHITSILALPDIWLIFFSMLCVFLLLKAMHSNAVLPYVLLGLALACGVNVHVRFWILALIASLCALWCFRDRTKQITRLLLITAPIAALGLLPIALFNLQHNFPLLSFQFDERHPWSFQFEHIYFFIAQVLLCTPLVFYYMTLCVADAIRHSRNARFIALTAAIHWLVFAMLGFFADGLRLNLHWPLVSYVLILAVGILSTQHRLLFRFTVASGWLASVLVLAIIAYWSQSINTHSQLQKRIIQDTVGWQLLAQKIKVISGSGQTLIVDHYITAAQLAYESNDVNRFKVLPHPANVKHGREQQLAIMQMQLNHQEVDKDALVVIEQTALKLEQQVNYYQNTCQLTGGLKLVETVSILDVKTYHIFEIKEGHCDIPDIFYLDIDNDRISGWIITREQDLDHVSLVKGPTEYPIAETHQLNTQQTPFLDSLDSSVYKMLGFEASAGNYPKNGNWRLCVTKKDNTIRLSPAYFD